MKIETVLKWFIGIVFVLVLIMISCGANPSHGSSNMDSAHYVHIGMSADRSQWRAMLACINSSLTHCQQPERLLFHVFCDDTERLALDEYVTNAMPAARHSIRFVSFEHKQITTRFARFSLSSSSARNLSSPHNYVRFYMPQLLPQSVEKILWLDNDILILGDVAQLFDSHLNKNNNNSTLNSSEKALAVVVKRRPLSKSMVRRIFLGIEGKPFGKSIDGGDRPRSLNMTHGRILKPLLKAANQCQQTTKDCFHFNAGVALYRLDLWRQFNITFEIEEWLLFLSDNPGVAVGLTQPPLIFYFWDNVEEIDENWNVGAANDIEEMLNDDADALLSRAKLLHFNGDNKPWLSSNAKMRELFEKYAPQQHPQ